VLNVTPKLLHALVTAVALTSRDIRALADGAKDVLARRRRQMRDGAEQDFVETREEGVELLLRCRRL
jgi:hypothetical protein